MSNKTKLITIDYEEYHSLQNRASLKREQIKEKIIKGVEEVKKQLQEEYKQEWFYKSCCIEESILRKLYKLNQRFGYIKFSDMRQIIHDVFNEK